MLELGDVVELGEEKFEVTQVPNRIVFPCRICELRDCGINKDFIALKYQHKAVSCYQLIGDKSYLKKVELALQVVYKYITIKVNKMSQKKQISLHVGKDSILRVRAGRQTTISHKATPAWLNVQKKKPKRLRLFNMLYNEEVTKDVASIEKTSQLKEIIIKITLK